MSILWPVTYFCCLSQIYDEFLFHNAGTKSVLIFLKKNALHEMKMTRRDKNLASVREDAKLRQKKRNVENTG